MATYEEIHGKRVETFSSDPTLDSTYEGQVWFNSTSGTLKTVVASLEIQMLVLNMMDQLGHQLTQLILLQEQDNLLEFKQLVLW
jgi:hypothetical protein